MGSGTVTAPGLENRAPIAIEAVDSNVATRGEKPLETDRTRRRLRIVPVFGTPSTDEAGLVAETEGGLDRLKGVDKGRVTTGVDDGTAIVASSENGGVGLAASSAPRERAVWISKPIRAARAGQVWHDLWGRARRCGSSVKRG